MMINELFRVIKQRQVSPTSDSYTARLFSQGMDEIIKKVGEESVEVMLAAAGQGKKRLVEEIADLTYHLLVLMAAQDIEPQDIASELECRRK